MSMKKKICPVCGVEFETERPNKRYCSYTCRDINDKARRMQWQADHPDYYANYLRQYREKKRNEKRIPKTDTT